MNNQCPEGMQLAACLLAFALAVPAVVHAVEPAASADGASPRTKARHWAFVPPVRPPLPGVEDAAWPRNEIDRFVLARLEREGLRPSPKADRVTLIRRLSLDLTGLPPEPDAVDAFLADAAPDAYARLVERLLASPHYGERWALRWLDLARYGDTDGYDYDRVRSMWPYRDRVIQAFNEDMPFDRFCIEQLAGDLLPGAAPAQQAATGFVRNSPVPQYRFDALVDRVSTVGTVFMGLTFECAQCHDHKYDPVSQQEFYRLFAIFNNDDDRKATLRSPLSGLEGETLVVAMRDEPRQTHFKIAGSFLNKGAPVEPGAPQAFHPLPEGGVPDRLALARWLADRDNPLIARVTVNRQWEALFGQGLVATSEDLGARTEPPTHPGLLDWLAVEFLERGWSLKSVHRLIVNSATYRQSSESGPAPRTRDPDNRLLARGARFRVEAEHVRDIALAAAGLLDRRVGGPSVFPPQPPGISENRERGPLRWTESTGPDRYRRGLYTFWKRAALHPALSLFDAPRRETSCARRLRTNTPLQALVTLNDPAFVEAALHLGLRMVEDGSADPVQRVTIGFRRCVARAPTAEELEILLAFYDAERRRFRDEPSAAEALLAAAPVAAPAAAAPGPDSAEWAAAALLANVLLNLDETITRP